jgi:hypothetical protein
MCGVQKEFVLQSKKCGVEEKVRLQSKKMLCESRWWYFCERGYEWVEQKPRDFGECRRRICLALRFTWGTAEALIWVWSSSKGGLWWRATAE